MCLCMCMRVFILCVFVYVLVYVNLGVCVFFDLLVLFHLLSGSISSCIIHSSRIGVCVLGLSVCGDALLGVYFKSISRVGSSDSISVSTVGMSCVCWFCMVVSGVNVCSIFDKFLTLEHHFMTDRKVVLSFTIP